MVITSRLREEIALDLDPTFALFVNCPTVESLRGYLGGQALAHADAKMVVEASVETSSTDDTAKVFVEATMNTNQPLSRESNSQQFSLRVTMGTEMSPLSNDSVLDAAMKIIAEESGVAKEEFTEDTIFADIG